MIDFRDWTQSDLENVLDVSFKLEKENASPSFKNKTAALLFFEPSTRTRMSFELACFKEGLSTTILAGKSGTSLEKGETFEDTVLNVAAMEPDVLIVRTGAELDLRALTQKVQQPILNGGWGVFSHPTQALLDIRTLLKKGLKLPEIKIVLVGDVKHSRVASSHYELSQKLGYQLAVCGPEEFRPDYTVSSFNSLQEAMQWGSVLMMLRFQLERHSQPRLQNDSRKFQVGLEKLKEWKKNGWLMHPGPINYGIELNRDVESYDKNLILEQVNSGYWVRRACIKEVLR